MGSPSRSPETTPREEPSRLGFPRDFVFGDTAESDGWVSAPCAHSLSLNEAYNEDTKQRRRYEFMLTNALDSTIRYTRDEEYGRVKRAMENEAAA